MSTKSTLAHGPNFHLYREMLEEDYVYLEVAGTRFEAEYGRVMVANPRPCLGGDPPLPGC